MLRDDYDDYIFFKIFEYGWLIFKKKMVLDFVQTIENNVPDCKILKLVLDIVYCDRERIRDHPFITTGNI